MSTNFVLKGTPRSKINNELSDEEKQKLQHEKDERQKEKSRKWYEDNKEYRKAYTKNYYLQLKEKLLEQIRESEIARGIKIK